MQWHTNRHNLILYISMTATLKSNGLNQWNYYLNFNIKSLFCCFEAQLWKSYANSSNKILDTLPTGCRNLKCCYHTKKDNKNNNIHEKRSTKAEQTDKVVYRADVFCERKQKRIRYTDGPSKLYTECSLAENIFSNKKKEVYL